ncbi:hypothetical protein GCM10009809_16360 [Isoptericola hypogeus]|uniref:Uncharacterized protein n=1 Tax=Isoptericola hypogeus TaxID=300179 RepID=A0ABN2JAR8_9MICO
MTRLVLLHGRDLDGHDPESIEQDWLGALNAGLAASGSTLRLGDDDADYVYYGDTLAHLLEGGDGATPPVVAEVQIEGARATPSADAVAHDLAEWPAGAQRFAFEVARDVLAGAGVRPPAPPEARAEGVLDPLFEALAAAVALLDRIPGVSAAVVLLIARDVWTYLHDDDVRAAVDEAVAEALPDGPSVVVAHSLGSLIAWSTLTGARAGSAGDGGPAREVPLLLTMGCPLPVRAVREALQERGPLVFPPGVRRWVNVRDRLDLVAVHDITPETFPLPAGSPDVVNLVVDNRAPGNHAAVAVLEDGSYTGYLATAPVAAAVEAGLGGTAYESHDAPT